MDLTEVYVGLGSNIGDSASILQKALDKIALIPSVQLQRVSSFYRTSPVSEIQQDHYVNAVCRFHTDLSPFELLSSLQAIEKELGKIKKEKNGPRTIDLDILFFGTLSINEAELQVPHPRWRERLFVVRPLADLTETIQLPNEAPLNLKHYLKEFPNIHHETVYALS